MRYIVYLVMVMLCVSISTTNAQQEQSGVKLKSISIEVALEEDPQGKQTSIFSNEICFGEGFSREWRIVPEYYSDGYNRTTVYAGRKGNPAMGIVRWDNSSHLWAGLEYRRKINEALTLILRPMKGVNSETADRMYFIAGYSSPGRFGGLLYSLAIKGDGKAEDIYLGPTYTFPANGATATIWIGPNMMKRGFYIDFTLEVPLK